jgi:hypothetical protein
MERLKVDTEAIEAKPLYLPVFVCGGRLVGWIFTFAAAAYNIDCADCCRRPSNGPAPGGRAVVLGRTDEDAAIALVEGT